jgi:ABC-type bacteriocin/lantibiotic exporter with double-glycine peptidase domain
MIPLTIALIVTGAACAVLSVIVTTTIRENSHLQEMLVEALAGKEHLKAENAELRTQNTDYFNALESSGLRFNELAARNKALLEALEAKPTLPKRAVRKTSAPQEEA